MLLIYKLIDGSGKGTCRPKTGQKVVFLEGEKGFSKNPFSKGNSDPKTGLKRAKGLSGPTLYRISIIIDSIDGQSRYKLDAG